MKKLIFIIFLSWVSLSWATNYYVYKNATGNNTAQVGLMRGSHSLLLTGTYSNLVIFYMFQAVQIQLFIMKP